MEGALERLIHQGRDQSGTSVMCEAVMNVLTVTMVVGNVGKELNCRRYCSSFQSGLDVVEGGGSKMGSSRVS